MSAVLRRSTVFRLPNGAVSAHQPDGGTAGGGARGANASDLQTVRGSANQVASGAQSTLGGGLSNIASGAQATVSGGWDNNASGSASWSPGGRAADTRGLHGKGAWASGSFAARGDAQSGEHVLRRQTTDATPAVLTSDGAAPGPSNQVVLPNNSVFGGQLAVVARESTGGGKGMWLIPFQARRDGAASATNVGTAAPVTVLAGTAAGWAVAVSADTVNGALQITVTGAAGSSIKWAARVLSAEVVG